MGCIFFILTLGDTQLVFTLAGCWVFGSAADMQGVRDKITSNALQGGDDTTWCGRGRAHVASNPPMDDHMLAHHGRTHTPFEFR